MLAEHIKSPNVWFSIAGMLLAVALIEPFANTNSDWSTVNPWAVILGFVALGIGLWRWSVQRGHAKAAESAARIEEHQQRLDDHRACFRLIKPSSDLRPADFGFQFLDPGEIADDRHRPFYLRYLPRRIVPFDTEFPRDRAPVYSEADLARHLASGQHLAIVGQPTMGKSRTLYAILKELDGWLVIAPDPKQPTPPPEAFAELVAGQKVVVVLDDLNDFAGANVDLQMFCDASRMGTALQWAVAATCRDGSELSVVRGAVDSSLRRFYDDIPLKVALVQQTDDEKTELAKISGHTDWDPEAANAFPTPGTIVMARALHYQRARFDEDLSSLQKDTLRALKLLTAAGVLPLTHQRLRAVVTHVYGHDIVDLGGTLDALTDYAFLRAPKRQDPVVPELAYLQDQVTRYSVAAAPQAEFGRLESALEATKDAAGLFLLGVTWATELDDNASALAAFDAALAVGPADHPNTLHNKGVALIGLGQDEAALATFDAVLALRPGDPNTLYNKGVALAGLGQDEAALTAFDAALALRPDDPDALHNKGAMLARLGQDEAAQAAFDAALALRPDDPDVLSSKGATLTRLGQDEAALAAFDAALALRPNNPETLGNKGVALARLGQDEAALAAFSAVLALRPNDPETLGNMGVALALLGQDEAALAAFDAALALRPDRPTVLLGKAMVLGKHGRHAEAREAFEAARALQAIADNDTNAG